MGGLAPASTSCVPTGAVPQLLEPVTPLPGLVYLFYKKRALNLCFCSSKLNQLPEGFRKCQSWHNVRAANAGRNGTPLFQEHCGFPPVSALPLGPNGPGPNGPGFRPPYTLALLTAIAIRRQV